MNPETKDKLRQIPKTACSKCGGKRRDGNPMDKCYECKEKYCFAHLSNGQINDDMSKNEEQRSVCDDCIKKHNYKDM